jgi:hypothetical protein
MKAIQTVYNGYRFRSRLEARWAVFFDALGIKWEYEPEGFEFSDGVKYLPDFLLTDFGVYAEVKPKQLTETEYKKSAHLPCILLDTSHPQVYRGYYCTFHEWGDFLDYQTGSTYGAILFEQSAHKKRMWFLFGEQPESYYLDMQAETKAKSARFEHGEKP